ncbi:MAG: di-trans,poly-cis-decaprenylcistransferase, partial [Planctomycetes bacterium]|nr:di-trans,poly-cis-decaprenylcistransferase [Planctomycetota bacterium]
MTRAILPRHIAFIMDGNGRWAAKRGLPRVKGHERGADAISTIMEELRRLGILEATFYALSSENYERRPAREIRRLLDLLVRYLDSQAETLKRERIKFAVIGRLDPLPAEAIAAIRRASALTAAHERFTFRLAINYGSRREIMDAACALARAPADVDQTDEHHQGRRRRGEHDVPVLRVRQQPACRPARRLHRGRIGRGRLAGHDE